MRQWLLPLLVVVLGTTGCATYSSRMVDLRPELANGNFDSALKTLEKGMGKKDRLLYLLERGLVLHYADSYAQSNEAFAAAQQLADDLYTKSISQGVLSLVTSDESISYRARPFEMGMVPYFMALNYLYLDQPAEAVVEARRADQLQAEFVAATLKDLREQDRSDLARIKVDPFLLYFSGMLHDQAGETNEAFISYRNAATAYQDLQGLLAVDVPRTLATDLTRTAGQLGFAAELDDVRRDCPAVFGKEPDAEAPEAAAGPSAGTGRVVVLVETGYVPRKTQVRFDFPVFSGEAYEDRNSWSWGLYDDRGGFQTLGRGRTIEYWISVAAPELQDEVVDPVAGCRLVAEGMPRPATTVVAANLAREARITFDAEKPTIFAKTILRGLTKYLATRQVSKSGGKVAGWFSNLLGSATEKADTRSWLTLPDRIMMGRLTLPAGSHDLKIQLVNGRGRVMSTLMIPGVEVTAGGWTFISRRAF